MKLGTLTLTVREWKCLKHRLEVPEAIAEVFADEHAEGDVRTVCEHLRAGKYKKAMDHAGGTTHDILAECIEGSTWVGCAETVAGKRGAIRVVASLSVKIGKLISRDVEYPTG